MLPATTMLNHFTIRTSFISGRHSGLEPPPCLRFSFSLIFFPAALIQLQGDTGSTLVFLGFFLVLYRFGLPGEILMLGVGILALSVFSLLLNKYILIGVLIALALAAVYFARRNRR